MSDYAGPLPKATPETKPYWEGLRQKKLMLPRCTACTKAHFYPRPFCPHCGGRKIEWFQASGKGKLFTFVINHRPPPSMGKEPYVIAVIELDEGPRLMSNLVGVAPDPEKIRCDSPVEIEYVAVTPEVTLPKFRLAGGAR
jgi:uncharacterized OB-fold protein